VRAGLIWDTRDREIGTHEGTWADVIVQQLAPIIAENGEGYTRLTATLRRYQPLGNRVTLAQRVLVQDVSGRVPFWELATIQTEFRPQDGLGGSSSIRGLPKDRYVGKGIALSNTELRWRATEFRLLGRPSSLVLSSFVDAGRVWEDGVDPGTAAKDLHVGYGGGVRLHYGPSFVISTDVGHSKESAAPIYIGLGYLF
jgi:outer membrane protein assembly factor BamA